MAILTAIPMSRKRPTKKEKEEAEKQLAALAPAVHAFFEEYPMFKEGLIEMCELVTYLIRKDGTVEKVEEFCSSEIW
jgi:hypothetical protein